MLHALSADELDLVSQQRTNQYHLTKNTVRYQAVDRREMTRSKQRINLFFALAEGEKTHTAGGCSGALLINL